jgi:hypothetical protein
MKKPLKTCTPTHPERYGTLSAPSSNTYAFSADGLRKTRYSVKWKSSEGKLVLKITDDVTVRICPFLTNVLIPLWGRTIVHCVDQPRNMHAVSKIQNSFVHFPGPLRGTQSLSDSKDDEHPSSTGSCCCCASSSGDRFNFSAASCDRI